ncbi:MAG TPA: VOC family protein [Terracidiphilus sp.]|jgi:PhnB protein|nr:VOC family protein [Terracidiphilus sp.]
MTVNTYLNFGGNCADAFHFYEQHLGGKILSLFTQGQMPPGGPPIAPEMNDKVMHARLAIGETIIMGSDVPPDHFQPIRSTYLCLSLDNDSEAERIYGLLSEGGEIYMPMAETFFASRFGQLRDRFGVSWMVIHEKPMGA